MARKVKKSFWQNLGSGFMSGLEAVAVALEQDARQREEEAATKVAVHAAGIKARTTALIVAYTNEVMSGPRYHRNEKLRDIAEWCDKAGYAEASKVARLGMTEKPMFNFGADPQVIQRLMSCLSQGML